MVALAVPHVARGDESAPAASVPAAIELVNGRFVARGEDELGLTGFAVLDEPAGPAFWTAYQAVGGEEALGAPLSRPFVLPDAKVYQLFEYGMLRWRPGAAPELAETLDLLWAAGRDDWLADRGVPPALQVADTPSGQAALRRLAWLTFDPIRDAYFAATYPDAEPGLSAALLRYGLPAAPPVADEARVVQRFDKAVLQLDLESSLVMVLPIGELLRSSGLLPPGPLTPDRVIGGQLVARAPRSAVSWPNARGWGVVEPEPRPTPTAPPTPAPIPTATPRPGATPTALAQGTPTARATPTGAPAAAGAALSIKAVVNQGRAEHVTVANEGSAPQELTGWVIRSATGGQVLPFPAGFVLAAGATVNVHSGSGASSQNRPPTDLFATGANVWNNGGDTAQLIDPAGRVVHQLSYAG